MRLANLHYLWLVILPVLSWSLGKLRQRLRSSRLQRFAEGPLLTSLWSGFADEERSAFRYSVIAVSMTALLTFAALRPQWGFTIREGKRSGIDIAVVVDVSESMTAEDVSPNRLERARREISDLLDELQGDRITLIAFAGVPFVEVPLTLDYRAFKSFLPSLEPDLIPVQGSHLESALEKALETLSVPKSGPIPPRRRAIVLLSDGEELEGDISNVIERCKLSKTRIYTIGVGSKDGAPIPTGRGYKQDKEGRVIISRLQDKALIDIAEATEGVYVSSVASSQDIRTVYEGGIRSIGGDNPVAFGDTKRWNEYFQLPLAIAVLLLTALWLRTATAPRGKAPVLRSLAVLLVGCAAALHLSALSAHAIDPEKVGAAALEKFKNGEFEDAAKGFSAGRDAAADDYRFSIGLGASHYRLGQFDLAKGAFMEAAGRTKVPKDRARALYNAGNAMVQLRELEDAIRTYEAALAIDPTDKDTQDNLAFAKKLLEEQQKQKQEDNKQNPEDKQPSPSPQPKKSEQPPANPDPKQSPPPKSSPSTPPTPEPTKPPKDENQQENGETPPPEKSPENKPSPSPSSSQEKPPKPTPEPKPTSHKEDASPEPNEAQPSGTSQPEKESSPQLPPSPPPLPSPGEEVSPSPEPKQSPSTEPSSESSPGESPSPEPSPEKTATPSKSSEPAPSATGLSETPVPTEKGLMVPSVPPAASPSASASPYPSSNSSNNGPKQSPTPEAPLPSAGDPLKDLPHDPLLDSVEEKGHTLKSYRLKKAQEILGVEQRKPPEKDW